MKIGNWGIKAGALGLALFLWFHAVTEHLYEKEVDIRLLVEDPVSTDSPDLQAIVSNEVPTYVRVLASGRGKDLLQLDRDDFVLRLRTEGVAGSKYTYRLQPSQIEKKATEIDIQIEDVLDPKELEIELDQRIKRQLPVRLRLGLQIAQAHVQVGAIYTDPQVVEVIGPRRRIEELEYIFTDSLTLVDVREDIGLDLRLLLPTSSRCVINPSSVRITGDIQILAENDITGVPIEVRNASGRSLRSDPAMVTVRVRGGVDVIANIDPENDIALFVDYMAFQNGNLSVQKTSYSKFEILEIIPPQVNLVSR